MKSPVTFVSFLCAALLTISAFSPTFAADTYPSRPIKLVVPFGAGATADIVARMMGELIAKDLNATVVVENKPGAGGTIGAATVATAAADGYTLVLGTIASHGISTIMMQNVTYDPVKDFEPIMLVANVPNMLVVNKDIPVSTPAEFVAYAKSKGQLDFTSAGVGTTSELAGEFMRMELGVPLVHVPYKEGGAALTDVIAGRVPVMIWQTAPLKPQIEAQTIKPIAALTAKRIADFPNVPTLSETLLPNFNSSAWFGILAPAGTPKPIVDRLYQALLRQIKAPDVQERLRNLALEPATEGPDAFRQVITNDVARWRKVLAQMQPKQ